MSHDYEATIASAFLDFMEKGYVYRGRKPVYWCIYDRTALAEAEVEYEDHISPSIWVKFAVVGGGTERRRKARQRLFRRHLDHHSLDAFRTTARWPFIPITNTQSSKPKKGSLLLAADRVAALQSECDIKEAERSGDLQRPAISKA